MLFVVLSDSDCVVLFSQAQIKLKDQTDKGKINIFIMTLYLKIQQGFLLFTLIEMFQMCQ